MHTHRKIKDALLQWLGSKGLPETTMSADGRCVLREEGKGEYLLWLPEGQMLLQAFIELRGIDDQHELDLVLLSSSMNLDPTLMGNSSMGYNPNSRQLILRASYELAQISQPDALDRHIAMLFKRAQLLQNYLDKFRRQQAKATTSVQPLGSFNSLSAMKAGLIQVR